MTAIFGAYRKWSQTGSKAGLHDRDRAGRHDWLTSPGRDTRVHTDLEARNRALETAPALSSVGSRAAESSEKNGPS
jgi:hypothetical protein